MLFGVIGYLMGGEFLNVRNFYNWFFIANSFIFLGIFLILATRNFCCHDEEKKG